MTRALNVGGAGTQPFRAAATAVRRGWLVVAVCLLAGGGVAAGWSELQTPKFASTATLYVTSGTDDNTLTAYQGSLASQQRVTSYTKLVTSDAVVQQALSSAGISFTLDQAKSSLSSTSNVDTVLLNITAKTTNREVSASLANSVANAMTAYVARLETPSGGGQPLAKLTVVTPAAVASSQVSPNTRQNVVTGLIIGLILGVGLVLARARFSTRVQTERDLTDIGDLPILAAIPSDPTLRQRGRIDFQVGASPSAEGFRRLRTSLSFANVDNPPKIILVTSAVAIEGKTTIALNLATAMAEAGERVVLVDADLRRPQIDVRTGLVGEVGLTNFLRGDGALDDLVQPTQVDGLWVLAAGPKPPNPAELLGAQRASDALKELEASFDYVIVDSPPILPVTDAVVLARWLDGVVLVARAGSTKIPDVIDAYDQISTSHTPVIGFVLTEAPNDKSRYGYYAVKPKRFTSFGRNREPDTTKNVLEPERTSKH